MRHHIPAAIVISYILIARDLVYQLYTSQTFHTTRISGTGWYPRMVRWLAIITKQAPLTTENILLKLSA